MHCPLLTPFQIWNLKLNNHNRNGTELQAESTMAVMVLSVLAAVSFFIFLHLFESLFLKPKRLRSKLRNQGIDGPSPSFLLGNLPEIKNIRAIKSHALTTTEGDDSIAHGWPSNLLPHLEHWRNRYGNFFSSFHLLNPLIRVSKRY